MIRSISVVIVSLIINTCVADSGPINSYPDPQVQEFQTRQERAAAILKELDHQINLYLNSLYPKEWLDRENLIQDLQDRIDKSEALKDEFQKLMKDFLAFRRSLENCHLLCPGAAYEGLAGASEASIQITNWFASHIQDQFFPPDWKKITKFHCPFLLVTTAQIAIRVWVKTIDQKNF